MKKKNIIKVQGHYFDIDAGWKALLVKLREIEIAKAAMDNPVPHLNIRLQFIDNKLSNTIFHLN